MESVPYNQTDAVCPQGPAAPFALPSGGDTTFIGSQNDDTVSLHAARKPPSPCVKALVNQQQQQQNPHLHAPEAIGMGANTLSPPLSNLPNSLAHPGSAVLVAAAAGPNTDLTPSECNLLPRHATPPTTRASVTSTDSETASTAAETRSPTAWHHALIVFDKLFCVCYVPPHVRPIVTVGELVLCEFGNSDNIGTVVADASPLVADVLAATAAATGASAAALEAIFSPAVQRVEEGATVPSAHASNSFVGCTPLFSSKLSSGFGGDQRPCRLPCVLRRGTNRDKKRVYFSRLRSNDALSAVQRMLTQKPLVAQAAEYQVNFASAIIYLAGERGGCAVAPRQLEQIASSLADPLRCETVEFRFVSELDHSDLDLTRSIVGAQFSEAFHERVVGYLRGHSSRSNGGSVASARQSSALQSSIARQAIAPPVPQPPALPSAVPVFGNVFGQQHAMSLPTVSSVPASELLHLATANAQPLSYTVTQPLQFVTYPAQSPASSFYDPFTPQPQPQQQTLALATNTLTRQSFYYVMPTNSMMRWDGVPAQQQQHQQLLCQVSPSLPPTPPRLATTPVTFVQTPPRGAQGFEAVPFSYLVSPNSHFLYPPHCQ